MNPEEFVLDLRLVPTDDTRQWHCYASIYHVPSGDYISKSWHNTDPMTCFGASYAWWLAVMGGVEVKDQLRTDKAGHEYRQHPLW